ncbi:uncharacterized protein LOC122671912 isoform X2 [Telopea speciosissima]|uniref:uncharacterized protein LOC122671912 isoform X2 n=1 Tax=Telopea speciosissima TaxID=54955 RepID=UPI001CC70E38|nr:uncharacterized protein LOC122671912 isoform X2 [Telopea speciosissima]
MRLLERSIEQAGLANIKPRVSKSMATTSIASLLKSYSVPLVLLSLAVFLQLVVIPSSFPLSHYDVLGIKRDSSIEEVKEAYEKLSARWNSGVEIPVTVDFIKIRYAFELLTNPLWKSDYDNFGIDEQLDVVEKVKGKYLGKSFSEIDLPLLDTSNSGTGGDIFNVITTEDFKTTIGRNKAWLIQVYSSGSSRCAQFSNDWKRIGLPSLVVFPPGCRSSSCLLRYQGDLLVDAVVDWFATTVLGLPRILYYSKESLGQKFLAKSGHHKVKVIFFSKTGERAAPILRQAAKDYWAYASFAFVLWREDESSTWWNMFEVESAPAVVFLKDPGVKPVVHHGAINSSEFLNIVEQNKYQDLPQLRSVTSMELGCDARAYSRAGNDTTTWYCVILAGRLSMELNKMRETMRRVQDMLRNDVKSTAANNDLFTSSIPAAEALKKKRLTFTWLDGEEQKKYCFFYLHSENSYETCGPRRGLNDVPQLFIVRYKRNSTEDETNVERKPKTIWDTLQNDVDPASQLVARYNGSNDIPQIIQWVSQIIKDGDSRDLPLFRTKTPELIPEDADPIWSRGAQSIRSNTEGMKQRIQSVINSIYDLLADPRLGPIFLLGALISSGSIWWRRSQSTQPSPSNQQSTKERFRSMQRKNTRLSNQDLPPSITDVEPKDAYQVLSSGSDSE